MNNPSSVREVYLPPSREHWLGTDYLGKDVWFQIVHGGQSLLLVAAAAALMSTAISVVFGALAAMIGGKFDAIVLMKLDFGEQIAERNAKKDAGGKAQGDTEQS